MDWTVDCSALPAAAQRYCGLSISVSASCNPQIAYLSAWLSPQQLASELAVDYGYMLNTEYEVYFRVRYPDGRVQYVPAPASCMTYDEVYLYYGNPVPTPCTWAPEEYGVAATIDAALIYLPLMKAIAVSGNSVTCTLPRAPSPPGGTTTTTTTPPTTTTTTTTTTTAPQAAARPPYLLAAAACAAVVAGAAAASLLSG